MTRTDTTGKGRLRVTLVRSPIGYDKRQKKIVEGLGLRRVGHTVDVQDHPAMRGMVFKVRHLVEVVEA
jgi:large subunit ribosomal protein L30